MVVVASDEIDFCAASSISALLGPQNGVARVSSSEGLGLAGKSFARYDRDKGQWYVEIHT